MHQQGTHLGQHVRPGSNQCGCRLDPRNATVLYRLGSGDEAEDQAAGSWNPCFRCHVRAAYHVTLHSANHNHSGSTGTIIRLFYLHTIMNGADFLWATTDVAIYSTMEIGIGVAASSLATLRPLIRLWAWRMGIASPPPDHRHYSYQSNTNRRCRRAPRRDTSPTDLQPTKFAGSTVATITSHGFKRMADDEIILSPVTSHVRTKSGPTHYESVDMIVTPPPPTPPPKDHAEHMKGTGQSSMHVSENEVGLLPPRVQLRGSFQERMNVGNLLRLGRGSSRERGRRTERERERERDQGSFV